ncbi:hypothetical protein F5Y03DRAFT_397038 [Xylaria venustula]|nr:hypothetical protein F5Y03DRAFT_397038 [Xylaria venustula]
MCSGKELKSANKGTGSSKRSSAKGASTGQYISSKGHGSAAGYTSYAGRSNSKRMNDSIGKDARLQVLRIVTFANESNQEHHELHVGLQIMYCAENGDELDYRFVHVTGGPGQFRRQERHSYDGTESNTFINAVHVVTIRTRPSDTRLRDTIWDTEIRDNDLDWYCQHFVSDALDNCAEAGLITEDQAEQAVDRMLTAIVELTSR